MPILGKGLTTVDGDLASSELGNDSLVNLFPCSLEPADRGCVQSWSDSNHRREVVEDATTLDWIQCQQTATTEFSSPQWHTSATLMRYFTTCARFFESSFLRIESATQSAIYVYKFQNMTIKNGKSMTNPIARLDDDTNIVYDFHFLCSCAP